jgi:hypothetical protein
MGLASKPLPVMPHPILLLRKLQADASDKVTISRMLSSSTSIMEQCALGELQEDEEVWFQDNAPRRFVAHGDVTIIDAYATLIFRSKPTKTFMADPTTLRWQPYPGVDLLTPIMQEGNKMTSIIEEQRRGWH